MIKMNMVFRYYNNEINFWLCRTEPQTLVPFSARVKFVCSELLSGLPMSYYSFSYLKNYPITQWTRSPDQEI